MIKLFLDDVRLPSDIYNSDGWIVVRTAQECVDYLRNNKVNMLSLDHDLGSDEAGTGADVVDWMDEASLNGWELPDSIMVHSANPYAAKFMRIAIEKMKLRSMS